MRGLLYFTLAICVMALGYWAYSENYRTQEKLRHASSLQREIGATRESLAVLRAEWAYLNRPDRLRDLADLNFDRLGLLPITAQQFGHVAQISYPVQALDLTEIIGATQLLGELPGTEGTE